MQHSRLILLPLLGLALATLACNALASRFGEAPSPAAPDSAPTVSSPAGQTPVKIEGGPTVGTPRETRVAISENTPILEQLAREEYDQEALAVVGRTFTYTVALTQTAPLLWVFGWCATSPELVEQNLEDMTLEFSVNGMPVDLGQFHVVEGQSGELPCRTYVAVLYDWPSGETQLEAKVTFDALVNDGLSDYPPGSQSFIYHVTVP